MNIKDKMNNLAGGDPVKQEALRQTGENFVAGWRAAAQEVARSPIAREWVKVLGIHPDRVVQYADALSAYNSRRGAKPDPENFKHPIVTPIRPR